MLVHQDRTTLPGFIPSVESAPEQRVAVEYDGVDWHSDPDAMRRDRRRRAALEDVGWVVISIVFEDVRYRAWEFIARVDSQLRHARAA